MEVTNINSYDSLVQVNIKTLDNEMYSTVVFNHIISMKSVTNYDLSHRRPCGQAVMDCITNAYSNHGWTSVALGLTSAFIPHTFAVVAAACYDRNCH